jgi:hypothetical protein
MLKIKITDKQTETRSGEKNGRAWSIITQINCFLEIHGEIRRLPLTLDNIQPYEPGIYNFNVENLVEVGRYGLEINRFKSLDLIPIAVSQPSAHAQKA